MIRGRSVHALRTGRRSLRVAGARRGAVMMCRMGYAIRPAAKGAMFAATLAALTVPLWLMPLAWYLAYQPSPALSQIGIHLLFAVLLLVPIVLAAAGAVLVAPI